jgi:UDP-3-O-[3-hydroxymyristoyl] N-acetylglucosamine deacetylase
MTTKQATLAKEVSFSGVGLHSGAETTLVFKPAPPNSGIKFIRTDLASRPVIEANISNAVPSGDYSRRTVLGCGDVTISTVEHVLAAVSGLGIDNLTIELDTGEPAEPDGSSAPFVKVLKQAGITPQDAQRKYLEVKSPVSLAENGVQMVALPYDGLRISFTAHYDHPLIGTQYASFDISKGVFESQIAPARTFSLLKDVEDLRSRGLIKGGSLENSIVIGNHKIMNQEPLRRSVPAWNACESAHHIGEIGSCLQHQDGQPLTGTLRQSPEVACRTACARGALQSVDRTDQGDNAASISIPSGGPHSAAGGRQTCGRHQECDDQ